MSAALAVPPDTARQFLNSLFATRVGHIPLFIIDTVNGKRSVAWNKLPEWKPTDHVYYPVAARAEILTGNQRGKQSDCTFLYCAYVDLDVIDPSHSNAKLIPSIDDALGILAQFPIPPTATVRSGGGIQAIWKFADPLPATDALPFLARWGATWAQMATRNNVHIDNVFDIPRVLRLPGTYNPKHDPPKLVTCDVDWGRTYSLDDLDQFTIDPPQPPPTAPRSTTPYIGPKRPGDAFNATHTAQDVLIRHGWTFGKRDQGTGDEHWVRPGKDKRQGTSATVYAADGHTCVWTSAVDGLKEKGSYDPLGLYVRLFHGGDFGEATRTLSEQGYGEQSITTLDWATLIGDAPAAMAADEWPDPEPISPNSELPPFPIECLPGWMGEACAHLAETIQIDIAVPAQVSMGVLSAAMTRKAHVSFTPIIREQPLNLYLCAASPSGAGKSPVFKALTLPLNTWQDELRDSIDAEIARAKAERKIAERDIRTAIDVMNVMELQAVIDKPLPAKPRVVAGDVTPEQLVSLLEHHGRIALISDEAGLLDMVAGAYAANRVVNDKIYLNAWDGADYYRDRKGSGGAAPEETIVRNPLLVVAITAQPAVLASMSNARQLDDKGFLQRFMWAIPVDLRGTRDRMRILGTHEDGKALKTYTERMLDICRQRYDVPVAMAFSPEASQRFAEWCQENEGRIGQGGDLEIVATWIAKQEASVGRLAALLHVADGRRWSEPIDASTLDRAIAIGQWWAAHAVAIWRMWGGSDLVSRQATVLAKWIQRERLAEFTLRDAYNNRRSLIPTPEEAISALSVLIDKGWLRVADGRPLEAGKRGQPSPLLIVNMKVHDVINHACYASHAHKEGGSALSPHTQLSPPPPTHETHNTHDPSSPSQGSVAVNTTQSDETTFDDQGLL